MNTDDLEKSLNKFEMTPEVMLGHILNITIQNNAILRALLNNQFTTISVIDETINVKDLMKKNDEYIAVLTAKLQAFLAAQ